MVKNCKNNINRIVMKNNKKRKILIILWLSLLIMCIPIKYSYKDGGTISYKAILYSYTRYHKLIDDDSYYIANEFLIVHLSELSERKRAKQ